MSSNIARVRGPASLRAATLLLPAMIATLAITACSRAESRADADAGGSDRAGSQAAPKPEPTPPIVATYRCREGAEFHLEPEEAKIYLNGKLIGTSDDWDDAGGGDTYRFPRAGWYYARFVAQGHRTAWVKIEVEAGAEEKLAMVKVKLEKK